MRLGLICAIVAAAMLSACLTPEQRVARLEEEYGAHCLGLGHVAGSAEYGRCLRALRNADLAEDLQRALSDGPLR
jgi:hypothetical protein